MNQQFISLSDGRRLGYCVVGKGKPVVYFHGTASSSLEVLLLKQFAASSELKIIGIDRPGYGMSTFRSMRHLQDFNSDINCLASRLGIDQFGVLGWSGGGAFALEYLACFPEHVTKSVVVGTPALPFDVSSAHNFPFARFVMKIPFLGLLAMKTMSYDLQRADGDIDAFLRSSQGKAMLHACSEGDLKFYLDPDWMTLLYQSMVEAFRQGNDGVSAVLQEHRIFTQPWSVSFGRICGDKLSVWHGSDDKTCRVSNAYLIAKDVVGSNLEVFQASGHCVMFENLDGLKKIFCSV